MGVDADFAFILRLPDGLGKPVCQRRWLLAVEIASTVAQFDSRLRGHGHSDPVVFAVGLGTGREAEQVSCLVVRNYAVHLPKQIVGPAERAATGSCGQLLKSGLNRVR